MKARGTLALGATLILIGCLSPVEAPPASPAELSHIETTMELSLSETSVGGGSFVQADNCLSIPSSFTILRGNANAEWEPNSPVTTMLTLEASEGFEHVFATSGNRQSPLHIEFGRVESKTSWGSFDFMMVLDHDGTMINQRVQINITLEIEGPAAPEFTIVRCAVS